MAGLDSKSTSWQTIRTVGVNQLRRGCPANDVDFPFCLLYVFEGASRNASLVHVAESNVWGSMSVTSENTSFSRKNIA